jgi:hypothetical protein
MASSGILAINYYSCCKDVGTATSISEEFFSNTGTLTAPEYNELATTGATDGMLPENKSGEITAIMLKHTPKHATAVGTYTPAKRDTDANTTIEVMQRTIVELFIGGVSVVRGPIWAFAAPPEWYVGQPGTAGNVNAAQNGGYMLAAVPHPVAERQSIRLNMRTLTPLSVAYDSGNYGNFWTATLQVQDRKAVRVNA